MKRIAAALTLFTRLPLWKWTEIPPGAYSHAVVFWPLAGWLTGGLTASTFLGLSFIIPSLPALICAVAAQLLFTGALHEDGLADFCDGFGGGRDKEGILRIMKDSHIGTYGVIGLISYFLLLVSLLDSLPTPLVALAVFAADPFSKFCASQLINLLPYARKEGAKNNISYRKMTAPTFILNLLFGGLPLLPLSLYHPLLSLAAIAPVAAMLCLTVYMKRKIGGYTGDCCGATYLICQLSMILAITFFVSL